MGRAAAASIAVALFVAALFLYAGDPAVGVAIAAGAVLFGVGRRLALDAGRAGARARADDDDPRWRPPDGRPQLVGRPCAACGRKISVSLEGASCGVCGAACHAGCVEEHRRYEHRPKSEIPYR